MKRLGYPLYSLTSSPKSVVHEKKNLLRMETQMSVDLAADEAAITNHTKKVCTSEAD